MKVDRIELYHVAIPLPKPFYPSWIPGYPQTMNRFTLLRLTTDDGVQGLAAGVAMRRNAKDCSRSRRGASPSRPRTTRACSRR